MLENLAATPNVSSAPAADVAPLPLTTLLGAPKATIVNTLNLRGEARISDLAEVLGMSEPAARRHLVALEAEGFVTCESRADGPGRPALVFHLTTRGRELFPHRYAATADELLGFLEATYGDDGMTAYLDWRRDRQAATLGDAVDPTATPDDRVAQLATALSQAGYAATVSSDDTGRIELTQRHCTISRLAEDHPELCSSEADAFAALLGHDVAVSRTLTIAGGHDACVCTITPNVQNVPPAPDAGLHGTEEAR